MFIGRTDARAETPILWPPDGKNWLIWKDPDARKDWGQEEKGMIEDEMVGWHHWLSGHEFEYTPGVGNWQRGLACCSPWGHKESDMTERLNRTKLNIHHHISMCNSLQYSRLGNFMDRRVWWATVHVVRKSWTWLNTHTHTHTHTHTQHALMLEIDNW